MAPSAAAFTRIEAIPEGTSPVPSVPLFPVVAVMITISWTIVALRFFTRSRITPCLSWDDYTIVIATVFYTIFAAAVITDVSLVLRPFFLQNLNLVSAAVDWLIVAETFYILTTMVFKISLGLFFLRLTSTSWQRRFLYAIVAFSTLYSIAYFFFSIFQCGVPKTGLAFAINKVRGKCVSRKTILALGFAHASVVSFTDWAFALFPIILLRNAKVATQVKVTIAFIVGLGLLGSICSLVRFRFVRELASNQIIFPGLALWSLLEAGIGIIANSLATLQPFVKVMFRHTGTFDGPGVEMQNTRPVSNWSDRYYRNAWGQPIGIKGHKYKKSDNSASTAKTGATIGPISSPIAMDNPRAVRFSQAPPLTYTFTRG